MVTMLVRTYDHNRYDSLDPFYIVMDRLPAGESSIGELGRVICDHEMQDTMGVTLLHKHFNIAADERLVRRYDEKGASIAPEAPSINHVACLWEFDGYGDGVWFPLEFSDRANVPVCFDQAKYLEENESFLMEFGDALQRFGVQRLFGLVSLHGFQLLNPSNGQIVLETSGDAPRSLKLEVVDAKDPRGIDSTQTLWMFEKAEVRSGMACPVITGAMAHCHHCPKKHGCLHCHPIACG